ncbi:hypothetical protein ABIE58_000635 [Roseovarius sp. MBR-78]|jgi:hypothetical protein|uniref:hypothetical protein n=1 Tax=Roseovarius sp. MBR-78 TaxID=3156460 RepID=UPI0033910054
MTRSYWYSKLPWIVEVPEAILTSIFQLASIVLSNINRDPAELGEFGLPRQPEPTAADYRLITSIEVETLRSQVTLLVPLCNRKTF